MAGFIVIGINMNSKNHIFNVRGHKPVKQKGLALFIALIALVVMSLAAVALIRSVDTNTIIAGNLGFKQSATVSADSGVETAISWLANNQSALNSDSTSSGYYATFAGDAKALVDVSAALAKGAGISAGEDKSGNTITYVIQRMCKNAGASDSTHCLFGPPGEDTNAFSNCDASNPCLNSAPSDSLMYRVTSRVTGPKNTVSYTQAFVY
jgi:type IV pilus assembly protein PilX